MSIFLLPDIQQDLTGFIRMDKDGGDWICWQLDNSHFGNYNILMHVISRKTLCDYWQKIPETEQPLKAWFSEAQKAQWNSPSDIKEKYRSASFLKGNRVVFNICGNKHRLIVRIHYSSKTVFIRFIGSHSEYDKINAEEV